ncbi:MAG: hypothetical protein RMJ51_05380 [Candidatus Calescibacterium sp.]|nr:hypothetical protein [Candidatus Calescibacterium sp.]MCX7972456.1 hypothetical protein [bacterium]MDW8195652.1 hypothetical protein [Candidatus Calescibacterium sp.]
MNITPIQTTIKDTFKIDFSNVDNSLEYALLPFNDSFIMSKVVEKIKNQGYAKIEGIFANLPIKLFLKPISSNTITICGKIGNNTVNYDVMIIESNANPNFKKQIFLKNIKDNVIINTVYNETHDQWGFQNLSSTILPSPKMTKLDLKEIIRSNMYAQLTLTYDPYTKQSLYKVKQNCTCTKELVRATYISKSSQSPEEQVETKLILDVTTDLKVEGKIIQDGNEWIVNYQIK